MKHPFPEYLNPDIPIILFDGDCALCSGVVQFVLDNDTIGDLHFASLQSPVGQSLLRYFGLPEQNFDSYLVVEGERYSNKFRAVQRMSFHMGGVWRFLYHLSRVIPRFIGDFIYVHGFKARYRLFGHAEACRLLDPSQKSRFLDLDASVFKVAAEA
ncbi:Uncharacterised protein [BD1-7 clade bacterium]|uniref:Thiol-disulfide oxidoreductase DCC n=1 Tax=BD1-7 clade bacterium TaxID=2029982 RepID=A0A5S9PMZ1_9GAMM|nr:Uncharacterised protein [BD1-7 clade bacterium]CAA0105884.1 Uncharacterised protein [BD1-7 clade bacterium]